MNEESQKQNPPTKTLTNRHILKREREKERKANTSISIDKLLGVVQMWRELTAKEWKSIIGEHTALNNINNKIEYRWMRAMVSVSRKFFAQRCACDRE